MTMVVIPAILFVIPMKMGIQNTKINRFPIDTLGNDSFWPGSPIKDFGDDRGVVFEDYKLWSGSTMNTFEDDSMVGFMDDKGKY
jgi:hypothetical protein